MKWTITRVFVLLIPVLMAGASALHAQTPVDDWGAIGTRLAATGWALDIDGSTPPGDVGLSGAVTSAQWTAIRGGFDQTITATTEQAVIVRGQLEINGEAPHWSAFRWGLFNHLDAGTLNNPGTPQAAWGYTINAGTDSAAFVSTEGQAHGYLVSQRIGAQGPVGGNGGAGDVHAVNGGSWISSFSGGTAPLGGPFTQAPRNATMPAGTYNFALSAHPLGDGTTEFRWYIVHEDQLYWHAGIHTDTTAAKTDFNGFLFAFRPEVEGVSEIDLTGVTVETGAPIEIPDPPFTAFYVQDWGAIGTRLAATGWRLTNDANTLVGDATLTGDVTSAQWTAIRGGFGNAVNATPDTAVIVTGQLEINGEAAHWSAFRWGIFNQLDAGTLNYQYTDSARWGYTVNPGTDSAAFVSNESQSHGYLISQRIGAQGPVGGNGGAGDVHAVNGGSWISSFSGGTAPIGAPFNQAPRNGTMPAGTYDFALSVRPMGDGTTEFRWYIVHEDQTYWHAGIHTDTTAEKTEFNGFLFAYRPEVAGITEINLIEVFVDRGDPIEIPEAPFTPFYVQDWGAIGTRLAATGWRLTNDANTLVGDATLTGDVTSAQWTAIRGGFGDPIEAKTDEAVIVTGEMEINGEAAHWSAFRWGLFEHMDEGVLNYQYTDSARWGYTVNPGTDSAAFVSNESQAFGYLISQRIGAQGPVGGNGGAGDVHAVNGGSWISSFSGGTAPLGGPFNQAPRNGTMPAGTYEFGMSAHPVGDGTTEFRWYIVHEDQLYWHAGVHTDTTGEKTMFDGFLFAYRPEVAGITEINLLEVYVDRGAPITIPTAPFTEFYVDAWGFLGGKMGGAEGDSVWTLTPGEFVGDVTVGGDALAGPAVLAGAFTSQGTPEDEALVITGEITLTGGGFEEAQSFRFGVFNMNLGTQDSTDAVGYVWTGDESATGYLFLPGNGSGDAPTWASGEPGTIGAIAGGPWSDTEGAGAYSLKNAVATGTPTAGTYEFAISIDPQDDGSNEIRVKLVKDDESYSYQAIAIDNGDGPVTNTFNAIVFGTSNSATTEMFIEALFVEMGSAIEVVTGVDDVASDLPERFALEQNYPNPFNPSTTIKFSLPEASEVTLEVFNLMGQKVATLVHGRMQPGFHQVDFDARNLASGTYFYRIQATDFVSTRKMMLVK
ncbi:MAG TPA: T9SS type A sorting domain-containing protein [Rhodothermales bacterium]